MNDGYTNRWMEGCIDKYISGCMGLKMGEHMSDIKVDKACSDFQNATCHFPADLKNLQS